MNGKTSEMDMLHGPLSGKLLLFTLPIALSSMVQQLFNAADTAVVGYFCSEGALAAVGTNTEIIAVIVTLSSGLSIGANILIANRIGQNEIDELPAAVQTAMLLAALIGMAGLLWDRLPRRRCLSSSKRRTAFLRKRRFTCGSICSAICFCCCTTSAQPS